ncbi:MAG: hypothetical protein EBZ48_04095 [Proteobacteria bacterium]|nr:hypothetical protein [Pseudomonadota bacterium]
MALFVSIFLAVIVSWFLVVPHLRTGADTLGDAGGGGVRAALAEQKDRCMQLLKDLELDFSTGKLSESDYTRMRGVLTTELAQLLTRIDECRGS